jgi:hypothetical protein
MTSIIPFDTQELFVTLTRVQISKLTPTVLSSLTDEQISWFTPTQISWLNNSQISFIRVNNFTIDQLRNILTQIAFFSSLNGFTKEKIESFSIEQIKFITQSTIVKTDIYVHTLFTGAQLEAMNPMTFKSIKHNILSNEQLSFIHRNLSVIETLDSLREDQIKSLSAKQIKWVTPKCLSMSNTKPLTSLILNSLSSAQFISLKLNELTIDQVKSLTRSLSFLSNLSLLTEKQIQCLSKEQFVFISTKLLEASSSVLHLLTKFQINSLSIPQLSVVVNSVPTAITLIDKIDPKLVPFISVNNLTVEGFNILQQLDKFNCFVDKYADIQKISYVRYLTNKQISELKPEHINVLNVSVLSFKQVPLIDITKLTKEQLGQFSNDNRGAMSDSQLTYYMDNFWNSNNDVVEEEILENATNEQQPNEQ